MTEDDTELPEEKKSASLKWLLILIAVVLVVQFGMWWLITTFKMEASPQLGQFGDMFGAINTLFSGLAFAGIIYTILLQRNELSLQRKELRDTRVELQLTREAHQKNCEIMDQQLNAIKETASLEHARYRIAVLPHFLLTPPGNVGVTIENGKKLPRLGIQNVGRAVKRVFIQRDSDDHYPIIDTSIEVLTCSYSYIASEETIELRLRYDVGCTESKWFVMKFTTFDDKQWNLKLFINIQDGDVEDVSFLPAAISLEQYV